MAVAGPVAVACLAEVRVVRTIDEPIDTCAISPTALAHEYTMPVRISCTRLLKSPKNYAGSTVWATTPKAAGQTGERHQIKVRINRSDLVVRARNS